MIRGLYTSAWGMLTQMNVMDVTTNNLANANTTAYKKDGVVVKSFEQMLTHHLENNQNKVKSSRSIGNMSLGANVTEIYTDFSQGMLEKTDNPLDLVIQGQGFFAVQSLKDGQVRYTRDGSFTWSTDGYLVTKDGDLVMDENLKPISFTDFKVDESGNILQGNQVEAKILITNFSNPNSLKKTGHNLYEAAETSEFDNNFTSQVVQGFVERSNVSAVDEMVNMIACMRAYETNSKAVKTHDELLAKTVNEVGRL